MKEVIYANTGEVKSGGVSVVLNSGAIGSCVVVTVYDSSEKMGIMAHIMLPGKAPSESHPMPTRYTENAFKEIFSHLSAKTDVKTIEVCLIGGANVLKREENSIGIDIFNSVEKMLQKHEIVVKAKSVGGFERRTAVFDVENGSVFFTVGDSKLELLWQSA